MFGYVVKQGLLVGEALVAGVTLVRLVSLVDLEWDCRLDSWEKALVQPAEYLVEFYSFIS